MINYTLAFACSKDGFIARHSKDNPFEWTSQDDQNHLKDLINKHEWQVMGRSTHELNPNTTRKRIVFSRKFKEITQIDEQVKNQFYFNPDINQWYEFEKICNDSALILGGTKVHDFFLYAELIDKIYDQTAPSGDDALSIILREPIGVVAAILPWNFPLLMLAWKIGPALASGCSVIVKPAEQTSLTALRVAELAAEAGIPRGVLQVLPGAGPIVGEKLGRHADVDMVSFTGSTETGRLFLKYSSESNLKKTVLECGGKNPAVVFNDAENLDLIAEHIVNGAFWNMGENCSAISRLIVHKDIKSVLLKKIVDRLRDWKTGDPLDPQNHLGALIDKEHCKKVSSYLSEGAVIGGEIDGCYIAPTIYETTTDDKKAKDEIFGPILSVLEVQTNEEAISLANKTEYGLTASIFSANTRNALRAARDLKAGTVTVNSYGEGDISTPFGGYKQSGFGGRDNGIHAHEQYCEVKTIWIDLTDPASQEKIE